MYPRRMRGSMSRSWDKQGLWGRQRSFTNIERLTRGLALHQTRIFDTEYAVGNQQSICADVSSPCETLCRPVREALSPARLLLTQMTSLLLPHGCWAAQGYHPNHGYSSQRCSSCRLALFPGCSCFIWLGGQRVQNDRTDLGLQRIDVLVKEGRQSLAHGQ